MDKKVLHYKKVIDTYMVTKHQKYNDTTYNSVCDYPHTKTSSGNPHQNKYGIWKETDSDNISEEIFKSYYGDITTKVSSDKITIVVEEYPNKISCKLYRSERIRRAGSKYFRIRKRLTYITYNFKYNNFYSGDINKKNKKILTKKVRVNDFYNHPFSSLNLEIRRHLRDGALSRTPTSHFDTLFTNDAGDFSNDIIDIFLNRIKERCGVKVDIKGKDYEVKFLQLYLETNKFKYPNNYGEYTHLSIPKKQLRKEVNLVSLYMEVNGLKGKKVRKILNIGHNLDFEVLSKSYSLLGIDYFNQLNNSLFVKNNMHFSSNFKVDELDLDIGNNNKQRVVNSLNDGIKLTLIIDHFKMIKELKDKHNYIFKPKFTNYEEFTNEHYDLSELLESYRKGNVSRFYGEDVISKVEVGITDLVGVEYYPKVLLTSDEYNNESQTQRNCVRTYIESPNNIIISLRVEGKDSKVRATLEYRFIGETLKRVQSLGSKNSQLSTMWDIPLEILDDRVSSLYWSKKLKIPELTKVYLSGNIIKRKSLYDGVILIWDNDKEMDSMSNHIDLPF